MEMKDFEVGKKYRHTSWREKAWLICVGHTTKGVPVMEDTTGRVSSINEWGDWKSLVEYREPREFWIVKGISDTLSHLAYTKKENAEKFAQHCDNISEIIHVKEVIE